MGIEDLLREGEAAIAAARWETARACFERALEHGEPPEALGGLSKVAMIDGEYERAIELKERAFDAFRDAGRVAEACDMAMWLAFLYASRHANFSAALGWKERAESVLEGSEESAAHGWIRLLNAPFSHDAAERERLAASALSIARRHGDTNLEADALSLLGEARVRTGRIVEGMGLLDEAMAAVTSGRMTDHFALGEV